MNSIKKYLLNFWNNLVIRIKKIDFLSLFKYLFLFLVTFLFILPFYLMFITSIKTPTEIMQDNALSLPKNGFHFIENYKKAFIGQFRFMPYFWNTFRVTFLSTLLGTFCSIVTAYTLSNIFHFRSKPVIILLLYLGLMTTSETLTIINYRIVSNLGWVDYGRGPQVIFGTDYALIIPYLINIVHILNLLITFNNVPKELYYSSKIDGTSNWKYLWKILVPINKSTIIVTIIFRIVATWNTYAWPELIGAKLLTNMARKTFDNEIGANINIQMAVAFLINIPLILIFIFFRKYIVSGENKSGIKG